MPYQSPLLERARKETGKIGLPIPRRGRIRLLLLIAGIALGFWWYRNFTQTSTLKPQANQQTPVKDDHSEKSEQHRAGTADRINKESKHNTHAHLRQPKKLDFDGVKDLLALFPPRLSHTRDTIHFKDGSLVLHYSIDTALQKTGMQFLKQYHPKYGAIVVVVPSTGRVLSLISYTNEIEKSLGDNLYCRSYFPAASIFKTIAAAGAIEKGKLTAGSLLRTRGANHTLYNSQLTAELADYREVPFNDAFAYSINPVFGRIGLYILGADGLFDYADRFGFNTEVPFELINEKPVFLRPDTSFALAEAASGFNQSTVMSPLFGAMLAAGISNQGLMNVPTLVDSITELDSREKVYERSHQLWRMPVKKQTAEELVVLMRDVARYGTARKAFRYVKQSDSFTAIEYGGKTGNVDKEGMGKVDWFVGFCRHQKDASQRIAVGVVTVHGDFWTIHSSFIGAEMMRKHIRRIQLAQKEKQQAADSISQCARKSTPVSLVGR